MSGVNTARMDALLMLVLAGSILATMKILGVTLIAATLVIPPAVARMLTNSFSRMLWMSATIGAFCGFVGMNLSYQLDVQSGPIDRARRRDAVRPRVRGDRAAGPRARDAAAPGPRRLTPSACLSWTASSTF